MKQIECFSCGNIQNPSPPLRRDEDGLDIFVCASCNTEYKIDMDYYIEQDINLAGKDFIVKTKPITYQFDVGEGESALTPKGEALIKQYGWGEAETNDKEPSGFINWLKEEWIYIVGGLLICYFFLI